MKKYIISITIIITVFTNTNAQIVAEGGFLIERTNTNNIDSAQIILTNLEGTKEVEKALELGATTYLVKAQYSLEDVLEKINQILEKDES